MIASAELFSTAYTDYRHHNGYQRRAQLLQPFPGPIIVIGCGFGFLVTELQRLNKQAWGLDASPYCWSNRVTNNFMQGNILYGPPPLPRFATVVTEDLLPWLSDSEAVRAAKNCALSGEIVLHFVTEQGQADYNYHSTGYWMSLLRQPVISLEGM